MSLLLLQGNAQHLPLAAGSVHCCVTSPPYWGLRDYGVTGQLGMEPLHDCHGVFTGMACGACYICHMRAVFAEVWRGLRDDGTLWVNIGDSYTSGNRGYRAPDKMNPARAMSYRAKTPGGLKPKDLIGIPWHLAFALHADGWYLRSEIIWHKPSPMPESVTDRPTKAHEQVFLLTKRERYFYDAEAIRETASYGRSEQGNDLSSRARCADPRDAWATPLATNKSGDPASGRNARTVWSIHSEPTSESHGATFPSELARRCILAGTSAHGCCGQCGAPWWREVESMGTGRVYDRGTCPSDHRGRSGVQRSGRGSGALSVRTTPTGWRPGCRCFYGPGYAAPVPCTVLDPFVGSGTTVLVARELGRYGVGLDLSHTYLHTIARHRLGLAALAAWEGTHAQPDPQTYDHLPLFAGGY